MGWVAWLMRYYLLCMLLFLPPTLSGAQDWVAPAEIPGTTVVDAEGLIELSQQRPDLVMIDSRISSNRKYGYVEGSHPLADVDTDCASLAAIAPALDTPLLFLCNGIHCRRSSNAAEIAHGCGYQEIYWFRGGIKEWEEKNYPLLRE